MTGTQFDQYNTLEIHELNASLYDSIRHIISNRKSDSVLDFGSGAGLLAKYWPKKLHFPNLFDLYDPLIGRDAVDLDGRSLRIMHSLSEAAQENYDVVVANFVHVTIENLDIFQATFCEMRSMVRENGIVLVGGVHPCFLDRPHRGYQIISPDEWSYIESSKPYRVALEPSKLVMSDYQWPISTYFNCATEAGLRLCRLHEIVDSGNDSPRYPSYAVMEFVPYRREATD